jgi:hypothetical protein
MDGPFAEGAAAETVRYHTKNFSELDTSKLWSKKFEVLIDFPYK